MSETGTLPARRPITLERLVRYGKRKVRAVYGKTLWPFVAPFKRLALQRQKGLRIHLGCGDDRFEDFLNVDQRFTSATDLTLDLSRPRLAAGSVRVCFSHAFFEHMFRRDQVPHLQAIREALEPGGVVCYLGLPDFANIARFYLERKPGIVGPAFDLFNVYRYTHGDPERVPWFLGQLHKSLFDRDEVVHLLHVAGFSYFVVFSYCYGNETLPVNLGFYAIKGERQNRDLQQECRTFLQPLEGYKVDLSTITFLDSPEAVAHAEACCHGASGLSFRGAE